MVNSFSEYLPPYVDCVHHKRTVARDAAVVEPFAFYSLASDVAALIYDAKQRVVVASGSDPTGITLSPASEKIDSRFFWSRPLSVEKARRILTSPGEGVWKASENCAKRTRSFALRRLILNDRRVFTTLG
jgi:hypothetical protein